MKGYQFTFALALVLSVVVAPPLLAQAKPSAKAPEAKAAPAPAQAPATKAAPTTAQAPAAPAKWVKPIKGIAHVEFLQTSSKRIGPDIVTVLKVKNTSDGAIALLKVDQYWYDKKSAVATGDTARYMKPLNPGEVIELTLKSPFKPDLVSSMFNFSHAGGQVKPAQVKKID